MQQFSKLEVETALNRFYEINTLKQSFSLFEVFMKTQPVIYRFLQSEADSSALLDRLAFAAWYCFYENYSKDLSTVTLRQFLNLEKKTYLKFEKLLGKRRKTFLTDFFSKNKFRQIPLRICFQNLISSLWSSTSPAGECLELRLRLEVVIAALDDAILRGG